MKATSLRRRLITWLALPLSAVIMLGGINAYHIAVSAAQNSLDLFLLDTALDLDGQLKIIEDSTLVLEISPSAQQILSSMVSDNVYFSVRNSDGNLIAGNKDLPLAPASMQFLPHAYYNSYYQGQKVRAITLQIPLTDGFAHIQVAQTLYESDLLRDELLLEILGPRILLVLITLIVIWFGVRRGLAPMTDISANIATRSHDDLQPIPASKAPKELLPFIESLNHLFLRIREGAENRNRFLANAAHQLRTPLAAIQAQTEAILSQQTKCLQTGDLEKLLSATQRTTRLANQLLTLARAEPGGIGENRQATSLDQLARDLADEWVVLALKKGIDLGFELAPALTNANPLLLRELLVNLLDNAVKYTPSGGLITVRTGSDDTNFWLEVRDNGPGIPAAEQQKVLERFYQSQTRNGQGCGLGLAIVDEIARGHGGQVTLSTAPEGSGLSVMVRLPNHQVVT